MTLQDIILFLSNMLSSDKKLVLLKQEHSVPTFPSYKRYTYTLYYIPSIKKKKSKIPLWEEEITLRSVESNKVSVEKELDETVCTYILKWVRTEEWGDILNGDYYGDYNKHLNE